VSWLATDEIFHFYLGDPVRMLHLLPGGESRVVAIGNDFSRWFLVAAIAGIGMKAQLKELVSVGLKPVLLMVGETAFLAGLVLLLMRWLG